MSKALFTTVLFVLFAASAEAKTINCYKESPRQAVGDNDYSVTFNTETKLNQNQSGNYSKRFSSERSFGCIIFSKIEVLTGTFKSVGGSYLTSTCNNKKDYAYMQFADQNGKEVFRIQCEKVAYEDQESVKFVPSAEDVQSLLNNVVTVE